MAPTIPSIKHETISHKSRIIELREDSEKNRFGRMDGKKKKEAGCFQMPLHYPKYTMKDYQTMPEWQLDRLLADYGLPVHDELAYKREFAIGAFLWPNFQQEQKPST
ncbi:hypothetical protein OIU77_002389 [Salix suchowensis]|uniref:DUF7722 domain-containing protein n=1 Tax=Salix suchowensis TaxID=1278906 RepID=A0ABQ9B4I2_9ROSI|nr:hypothetical protein OIU77_002389 [Salix suchowensis]